MTTTDIHRCTDRQRGKDREREKERGAKTERHRHIEDTEGERGRKQEFVIGF